MMRMDKIREVRGAGGGGGKSGGGAGRAPIEQPDSLNSKQYARVLDLISEGEIEGLKDGLKSVYLDDTPIQNPDGSYNFSGVTLVARDGTQDQDYIPGFGAIESEKAVGIEVTNAVSVSRSITNANVNAARITVSVPQLSLQNTTTGDLGGTSVEIAIDVQSNGGGYIAQALRQIFSSQVFAIGAGSASNTVESTRFNVTVGWTGQAVHAPQSCTFQLEYRPVGGSTWTVSQTYTFSGGAYNTGGITGATNGYSYPSGSRTFALTLPQNTYEFRVVKTNGSLSYQATSIFSPGGVYTGATYGGSVAITAGTAYVPGYTDVISGKTTSRYQRAYRIQLTGSGPWDIRVRRITADSTQTVLQNKTFWDSYTEIIDAKLRYPNSAIVGLQIDAAQFQNIPSRGYLIRGIKVQIPSNYDPLTRIYTGAWDGTFVTAWSDNPAWCMYDLITNDRYGLGQFVDVDQVDKWSLYNIAQYCDEMVDDGYGGIEPRFTCNLYLQTRAEAYTVLANMASVFRAITFWSAGAITTVQDAPSDPVALFTAANVIDGTFNYSGSSAKTRHTVVLVSWNDPADNYRQKVEYVEDADGITRFGVIQTEVVAFGCTSRGQAHRYGRAIIHSELLESETITFRTGLDGTVCYPGAIIQVQDQFRSGVRFGGRLVSGGVSQLTLDAPVTLEAGKVYTLSCVLPDGTVEDRTIVTAAGDVTVVDVDTPFTQAPQDLAIWIITTDTLQATSWRIVSVSEVERAQIEIIALAYREDKYDAIEDGLVLEPISYSAIKANPSPVSNLNVTESLTLVGLGLVGVKATVSWNAVSNVTGYIVQYYREEQNISEVSTSTNTIDIQPLQEGNYVFTVIATNSLGRKSQPVSLEVTIYGKTLPPVSVENFSIIKVSGVAQAQWSLHADLDVQVGGQIVVRHSPLLTGATWQDGFIFESFSGNAVNGLLPLVTGTYMAKARDSSGNWSEEMVAFVATEGLVTGFTTVATTIQNPDFAGGMSNVIDTGTSLQLVGNLLIDDLAEDIDDAGLIDSLGGIVSSGSYDFDAVMDLATVATRRYEADIEVLCYDTGEFIDTKTDLIDSWGPIDGDAINDCDATLYASITDDDPASSPTWGEWTPFVVSDLTCRAARFQLLLESGSETHNIRVSTLRVDAKVPA